ncbi:MAG: hypothetical protein LC785_11805 [Acidobacteria bacterium]|nr:hypothetical protein [Acidobacteriota bacterium]
MGKRVEWVKSLRRHGRSRPRQFLIFLVFEAYYQLCTLRGYRPRHLLDPSPEWMRRAPPVGRVLMVWPRLPPSLRALDRIIFPGAHAELVPYTPEAFEAARASGRRAEVMTAVLGELRLN